MSIILYGIKNCDTVKKARRWLEEQQIEYAFHDFRADGLDKEMIKDFLKQIDWQTLLNKRGSTWRKLSGNQKNNIDGSKALELMAEHPALIKRPVLVNGSKLSVGFSEKKYENTLL